MESVDPSVVGKTMILLSLFLSPVIAQQPRSLDGTWGGLMIREGAGLEVSFSFVGKPPGFKGAFSAPSLRAIGIPLSNITQEQRTIRFDLTGDAGTTMFVGELREDTLEGTFKGFEGEGTFSLKRVDETALPYRIEEVGFANGPVNLSGTLLLPNQPGRHPAVIFLHGSGPEGRYGSLYLADHLARLGVAGLIYDKRGVGESTGDWRGSGFSDLAKDAAAGVAFLKTRPEIDPEAIGSYGHSQGGFISPLLADVSPDVKFLVVGAAHGGVAYQQDLFRTRNSLKKSSFSADEQAAAEKFYQRFVDVARTGEGKDEFWKEVEQVRASEWFPWLEIPPADHWVWDFYKLIGNFDPSPLWEKVRIPVLLIYGEKDQVVPVHESIVRITSALEKAGNHRYGVLILPRAGHDFTIQTEPGEPFQWRRVAPGFADQVAGWIRLLSHRGSPADGRKH